MTLKEFRDNDIKELDGIWEEYRSISIGGITRFAEIEVRDLFQRMSLIQSQTEMRVSLAESVKDKRKLDLELSQTTLLREYTNGPMNKRISQVTGDSRYQIMLQSYSDAEDNLTILKGGAKAVTIAAGALSREISARLK
jgi:hypothetical protein